MQYTRRKECVNGEKFRRNKEIQKKYIIQNKMPEEWYMGIIVPLHKKEDRKDCTNYRTITLLNTTYKILENRTTKNLKIYYERVLGNYHNGIRSRRSMINAIRTLEQIIEKSWEHNRGTSHL